MGAIGDDDEDVRDNDDLAGDRLHVNYLTTCIEPFRTYIPSPENLYRIPFGNVRITFDGGGGRFNNITGGLYPGYNPDIEFTFEFDLQGLPSNCDGCRIQVNSGMTCDLPEIRFWDRSVEGAVNPWRPEWGAVYHSNQHGQARGYFSMFNGFRYDDHKSRTVVVFDRDKSTRIGCGVIRRSTYGECGHDPSIMPSASPIEVTLPPVCINTLPPVPQTAEPQSPVPQTAEPQSPAPHTAVPQTSTPQTPYPIATAPPLQTLQPTLPFPDPSLPTPCPTNPPTEAIGTDTERPVAPPINEPGGKGVAPPINEPEDKSSDEGRSGKGGKGMSGKKGGKKGRRLHHRMGAQNLQGWETVHR